MNALSTQSISKLNLWVWNSSFISITWCGVTGWESNGCDLIVMHNQNRVKVFSDRPYIGSEPQNVFRYALGIKERKSSLSQLNSVPGYMNRGNNIYIYNTHTLSQDMDDPVNKSIFPATQLSSLLVVVEKRNVPYSYLCILCIWCFKEQRHFKGLSK